MKKRSLLTLFTVTMILMLVCVLAMTASATIASTDVASVSAASGTTNYTDLAAAIAQAAEIEDSTVTLLADVFPDSNITVNGGRFTIDLNGYRLLPNDTATVSLVTYGGNVMLANHKEGAARPQ